MSKMIYTAVGVHIKVADLTRSREFYEGILGFTPAFGYGDDAFRSTLPDGTGSAPEKYRGITYEPTPSSPYEIAEGHIAVKDPAVFTTAIDSPKVSALIRVSSLIPLIVEKGVRPTFPVRKYYWGTIEVALRDPDGFVVILAAPYSDEEYDALSKAVTVEVVDAPGA